MRDSPSAGDARVRGNSIVYILPLLMLGAIAFIAVRAYRIEASFFEQQRRAIPDSARAQLGATPERVEIEVSGAARVRGWYLPARDRAAVILAHGAGGDRTDLLGEARVLAAHGFGVLLFDWPGHGESEGAIHWGGSERQALSAVIDHVRARSEVDPRRVGALGYSMGGFILAQLAAADARLAGVALAGSPIDAEEQTRYEYRHYGPLAQWPALWAARRHGMPLDEPSPKELVAKIAPRPLLLIAGGRDEVVPAFMTRALFAAAREPKELVVVPEAGHCAYLQAEPERYAAKLIEFFDRALALHR